MDEPTRGPQALRLIGVVLGALALVGIGVHTLSLPSRPLPPAPAVTPTVDLLSFVPPTSGIAGPGVPAPDEPVVAVVNGEPVHRAEVERVYLADQAIAALLNQPASGSHALLDRVVNTHLVRQAARGAGFSLSDRVVREALDAFLQTHGATFADLEAMLPGYGLTSEGFFDYYRDLLLVDTFIQEQIADSDITFDAYLARLHRGADLRVDRSQMPVFTPPPAPNTSLAHEVTPTPTETPPQSPVPVGLEPGMQAPAFSLPTLKEGGSLALSDLRGQPVVLSFWVSWCAHCRTQTPYLVETAETHTARLAFVGINVKEPRDAVDAYVTEASIPYPVLLDAEGDVAARYRVSGLPTTYFVDADGRVVARHVGGLNREDIARYIKDIKPE